MSKTLEGKVAFVTGASRGIGAAIAKRLAAEGAKVAITYTKGADAASAVVRAIEASGGHALALQADATDAKAVSAAIDKTVRELGALNVLVNNAGTAIPNRFEDATLDELDRVIDLNIRGMFIATHAALKHLGEGGRIIMIGSCVGERVVTPGLAAYSATKGAVKYSRRAWRGRSAAAASPSTTSSLARSTRISIPPRATGPFRKKR